MTPPQPTSGYCAYPNIFSSVVTPAVQSRLPAPGSFSDRVLDYTTRAPSFFQTVSQDLCDDGRMSTDSGRSAVSFISRGGTSAVIGGATATGLLFSLGAGSIVPPLAVLGLGAAALATLPPLVERAAFGVGNFFNDIFAGIRGEE